jgi:integrase
VSAPLLTTATPGIYKRGSRYVVIFRDPYGKQRKRSARTLAEARDLKSTLTADVARGEYRTVSKIGFTEYALEWIEHYGGRTSRGIREQTKADYKDRLEQYAIPFFGRMQLAAIEPRDLKRFAAHVAESGLTCRTCRGVDEKRRRCRTCGFCSSCGGGKEERQECLACRGSGLRPGGGSGTRSGRMAPNSVRLALAPVKALLATAFEEGVIRANPAAGVRLVIDQQTPIAEDEHVKALSEDELRRLLGEIPPGWRLFFEFLAHSGLRIGEAIALRWSDVDFNRRRVSVERRYYRGSFDKPKSKYGRRKVPLSEGMARDLEARWLLVDDPEGLVFPSSAGTVIDSSKLMSRVLKPAARRVGVPWAGFHTFRHTCATTLFRRGLNAKQVQVWLGHHSPAFTLATYVHFLDDDLPDASFLDDVTGGNNGNGVATSSPEIELRAVGDEEADSGSRTEESLGTVRAA